MRKTRPSLVGRWIEIVLRTVLSLIKNVLLGLECSKPTRAICCTLVVIQARLKEKQSLEEVKSSLMPQDSVYLPCQPEYRYIGAASRYKKRGQSSIG